MVRHKLPQGFNERIREREEAKRQKLARTADTPLSTPAKLKTSMTTAKQGHKRLKQEQAKTEQQAGELLLENLDKAQLLALLQTQMQGGGAPDGSPRVSQETEEDEEEEDGNEEEDAHYDLFNTIFFGHRRDERKNDGHAKHVRRHELHGGHAFGFDKGSRKRNGSRTFPFTSPKTAHEDWRKHPRKIWTRAKTVRRQGPRQAGTKCTYRLVSSSHNGEAGRSTKKSNNFKRPPVECSRSVVGYFCRSKEEEHVGKTQETTRIHYSL